MLILGAYVVTSIASIMIVKYNYFRMYKDVSDKGYKINTKKVLNNTNQNKRKHNYKNLLLLFPIVNLFIAADKVIKYNKIKPFLVDSLKSTSFIEKMNDEEKEYYKSNPTINTAVNVVVYSRYKEEKMKHQDNSDEKIIGIKEAGQILNKSKSKMLIKTKKI